MEHYVLDTSALFTLRYDEEGADEVGSLLSSAQRKKSVCHVSFLSFMEYYYCVWKREGKSAANKAFLMLKMLPVLRADQEDDLLLLAGEIKASYPLSVIDSWVAATAIHKKARLVHKDPEFEPLAGRVELVTLPYKN